tara:strand:+ start:61 stop:537 length:477 start_codon:yes stop_codon:yes gene_type:complete
MYNSFTSLFSNIWESLDDVFICVTVAIVLQLLSKWLHWCLHSYFRLTTYVSDVVDFLFVATFTTFLLIHLFGPDIAISLFSGFSIGMGYAFQPFIISLFSGVYSQARISRGDKILLNNKPMTVEAVSLLHICVRDGPMVTYVPHAFFQTSPLTIVHSS